jgi:deaminated glutathione amidase
MRIISFIPRCYVNARTSLLHSPRSHNTISAQALFLPEASDYIASTSSEAISLVRPATLNPFLLGLQHEARTAKLPINVGIHEPADGGTKVKNTLVWIDEHGEITSWYQKVHLFDVDLPDGPVLKESNGVEAGKAIEPPIETPVGKVGLMICFDLRFPEISLRLRRLGAQVLVYPSAFTVPTGKAHWEALLRARAIENQAFVVAAAQCGRHNGKRMSYGDSIVIGPWGEVVGRLSRVDDVEAEKEGDSRREPDLLIIDIDLALVEKARREVPLLRRTDVYPEV